MIIHALNSPANSRPFNLFKELKFRRGSMENPGTVRKLFFRSHLQLDFHPKLHQTSVSRYIKGNPLAKIPVYILPKRTIFPFSILSIFIKILSIITSQFIIAQISLSASFPGKFFALRHCFYPFGSAGFWHCPSAYKYFAIRKIYIYM